jgi:ABC-type sugar transport system substrate-binding protein
MNFKSSLTRGKTVTVLAVSGLICLSLAGTAYASSTTTTAKLAAHDRPLISANAQAIKNAEAVLAPYEKGPTAFPVTAPLNKLPKGDNIAVMNCGTTTCEALTSLIGPAATAIGVNVTDYVTGPTPALTVSGFTAMLANKPNAVIILPATPLTIEPYLTQLQTLKIPVITSGIVWTAAQMTQYGIDAAVSGNAWVKMGGQLMAAYAVEKYGTAANVVIENVPDLQYGPIMTLYFDAEMTKLCPSCTVKEYDIPITALGSTDVPGEVANLQGDTSANIVATIADGAFDGLPAALSAAGITNVTLVGNAPGAINLSDIEQGTESAGFAFDEPVQAWEYLDIIARVLNHQALSGDEKLGLPDVEFITRSNLLGKDMTAANQWTGYPTYQDTFETLWGEGHQLLVVRPASALKSGQSVKVSGSGFIPNDHLNVVECLVGATSSAQCDHKTLKAVTISATGVLRSTTFKVVTGKIGTGSCGTTTSNLRHCAISVANATKGDSKVVGITFK